MDQLAADLQAALPDLTRLPLSDIAAHDNVLANAIRRLIAEAESSDDAIAGFQSAI